jgi:hypothetical protein
MQELRRAAVACPSGQAAGLERAFIAAAAPEPQGDRQFQNSTIEYMNKYSYI